VKTVVPARVLVLSDVHCNVTALERVLEDAGGFDAAICAGDVVGYGPNPAECVDAIAKHEFRCVTGNHDHAIVTGDTSQLNAYAAAAISIQQNLLNPGQKRWLGRLMTNISLEAGGLRTVVCHGSPSDPLWEYVRPMEALYRAEEFFQTTGADLLILGHTHIPFVHRFGGRVILNPGSVGQPRDGDPRASYMLVDIDDDSIEVTHRRIEYDIDEVASRIIRLRIPELLAARLFSGW